MELNVLGCGDAFGNGGRYNTSFLVSNKEERILVDCGASTLIRLKQEGVRLEEISTIVISHFHGDHYGGIPFFLISSMFEFERKAPLTIIGPQGVKERVFDLLETMYPGTVDKLGALKLSFIEFSDAIIEHGDIKVLALEVEHSPPSVPHGIRIEWEGKVFAFSGDTSWTDNLITLSDRADLFICECNFLGNQAFGHLCYSELLEKRNLLTSRKIWLSHMGNEVLAMDDCEFDRLEDGLKIEF